jgi:hypothetical protein
MLNQRGSLGLKLGLAVVGFGVIIGIMLIVWGVGVSNGEIKLRNKIVAKVDVIDAYYDKMWKTIKQQAGCTDEYKSAFKEIYPALMEGRYSGDNKGKLMLWIKEDNPEFKPDLLAKLMAAIEGLRDGFFTEQKQYRAMIEQHDNMRMVFPSSTIVGGRPQIVAQMITSGKTKEVRASGEENDVDLFKKGG